MPEQTSTVRSLALLLDLIGSIPALTTTERAVLWCLARHSSWEDGGGAYPSVPTIAAWTGLKERQVQRTLRRLECRPEWVAAGGCVGDAGCTHRGLIVGRRRQSARSSSLSTEWELDLRPVSWQLHMPEVGTTAAAVWPALEETSKPAHCTATGCAKSIHARELCATHYKRLQRGQPLVDIPPAAVENLPPPLFTLHVA
ncbi:MAG: helix-turn-helix domain-containing protein [Dehalococcoidia bacterium]